MFQSPIDRNIVTQSDRFLAKSYLNPATPHLKVKSQQNGNSAWDREEQLSKNQPAIELIKQRIARNKLMSEEEYSKRAEFLTDFQKTVDEQRISERKLYFPR